MSDESREMANVSRMLNKHFAPKRKGDSDELPVLDMAGQYVGTVQYRVFPDMWLAVRKGQTLGSYHDSMAQACEALGGWLA